MEDMLEQAYQLQKKLNKNRETRGLADLVGRVSVGDAQSVHGTNHGVHCHEDVLIDEFDETSAVVVRVAGAMNDSHLLNESALARLSRTFTAEYTDIYRCLTFGLLHPA